MKIRIRDTRLTETSTVAQLSLLLQSGCAMLPVIENFATSLKVTQDHSK